MVSREDALVAYLKDDLELRSSVAEVRARQLMDDGVDTVRKFRKLPREHLLSQYVFRRGDLVSLQTLSPISPSGGAHTTETEAEPDPES
jgi:hypothetical protein